MGVFDQNCARTVPFNHSSDGIPQIRIAGLLPPLLQQQVIAADWQPGLEDRETVQRPALLARIHAEHHTGIGHRHQRRRKGPKVLRLDAQSGATGVLLLDRLEPGRLAACSSSMSR